MSQNKLLASVRKAPFCCTLQWLKIMTRERMVFAAQKKMAVEDIFIHIK